MKTHRETLWLWRSLALLASAMTTNGCVDALVGEVGVCRYGDESYALGEKFRADDGCNECSCTSDGGVVCSDAHCVDGGSGSPVVGLPHCLYENKVYLTGERFYALDGCNSCFCSVDGGSECTEKACTASDAGAQINWSYDAGPREQAFCASGILKPGDGFLAADGCNKCVCQSDGTAQCTDAMCVPDGAWSFDAGAPDICGFGMLKPGDSYLAADGCNKCTCTDKGTSKCTDAICPPGSATPDAGSMGSCNYQGKTYPVGAGFERGDNCNKCQCVANGLVECTSANCNPPPGCVLGDKLFPYGTSLVAPDGCNTFTCSMTGGMTTTASCPPLGLATNCTASALALAFPATLVYRSGDSVAVAQSRCVNGQTSDFTLCFDDLAGMPSPSEVGLYVVPTGTTRACGTTTQRAFSLTNLRAAYGTSTGQMSGKLVLRGAGEPLFYQFGN